uniref:Uncharacterized protein n=1 Tax=Rhizophagus irregularis (strain DAOM 181602 / DAOM 197198 / MUCL 43194) TaxID=747089 RepID=U9TIB2_RHIID
MLKGSKIYQIEVFSKQILFLSSIFGIVINGLNSSFDKFSVIDNLLKFWNVRSMMEMKIIVELIDN